MRSGRPGPLSVDANGLQLGSPPKAAAPVRPAERPPPERYRRLPTGAHGMARDEVARDQRERLQRAMTELIADRGYQAVRILDLTQLAHVSRPTFYELYPDKEELLLAAYNDIAARTATTALAAFDRKGPMEVRLRAAMHSFADLAAAEPHAMSLFLIGAFGAGPKALARRKEAVEALERQIQASRDRTPAPHAADLTVKVILGGIREVAVARLHHGTARELHKIGDELITWAFSYPAKLPPGLDATPPGPRDEPRAERSFSSERARRAQVRLPSGRHDLPREVVESSQRERILDATAEIVAEKGLAALTIPEIASRANVSHETFYEMFKTKMDAFLSTQKVGMELALGRGVQAWEAHMPDWPRAIDAGLRGVVEYLVAEPAFAHLTIVDAFGASPETVAIRDELLRAFATYFEPGYTLAPAGVEVPAITAEAVVGGCWQVLHHYISNDRIDELADAAPQLTYMMLTPFLGSKLAAETALSSPALREHEPAHETAGA